MRAGETSTATGPTELPAPLVLDRYRLQRRLGTGGFGTVWLARDERLGRDVAIKILARERVMGGRFEREARVAARLSHPAIVTLYEASADDEGAYLVSELVRGTTLDRALGAGRLSDQGILAIGLAICDALEHAHRQGVVHRDIKPSNILIPARPGAAGPPAKLTDFGVARVVGGDTLTRTGELVGTAAYMAPEQAAGREAAEPADLYSLALVLYEALTGLNPVPVSTAAHPTRRLSAHLPPLRRQRRELPRELGQAIDLALRPRALERGRVADLHRGLEAAFAYVDDIPGVVEPSRLARAVGRDTGSETDRLTVHDARRRPRPVAAPPLTEATAHRRARPSTAATAHRGARPSPELDLPGEEPGAPLAQPAPRRRLAAERPPLSARALAAAVAAGLTAWTAAHLFNPLPLPGATLAFAAAVAVLLLPRLGWLALTLAAVSVLAAQGRPGSALALGLAGLLPVLAFPRAGSHWPLAAVAPGLALLGLVGGWPALAAHASTPWRRAALGAIGWCWLALAGALAGRDLYLHRAHAVPAPGVWTTSLYEALHHVLLPLLAAAPAGAVVWGGAAAVLPLLRRGTTAARDAVAVALWTAGLGVATVVALRLEGAAAVAPGNGVLALGLLAAAAVALAPTAMGRLIGHRQGGSAAARLA